MYMNEDFPIPLYILFSNDKVNISSTTNNMDKK